jgi:hypothetical protein
MFDSEAEEEAFRRGARETERRLKKEQEDKAYEKRMGERKQRIGASFDRILGQQTELIHLQEAEAARLKAQVGNLTEELSDAEELSHRLADLLELSIGPKKIVRDKKGRAIGVEHV